MQNLRMGALGGAHLVFECLGVLDAIMTTSYEKLMINLEINAPQKSFREAEATRQIRPVQAPPCPASRKQEPV